MLEDKNGILLSTKVARALFGSAREALGQTVDWNHISCKGQFTVTGIFQDPPSYSTAQFDVLFNMELLIENMPYSNTNTYRGAYGSTYLLLKDGTNIEAFNRKIKDFVQGKEGTVSNYELFMQRYSDRYLHGKYENGAVVGGRIICVRLFTLIAVFILLIVCINFMNLSTARATLKMKEIGVKKTIGASRQALVIQFLSESLFLAFLSMQIALLLVGLLLPAFNDLSGKALQFSLSFDNFLAILAIIVLTGLLAGSYPAFYLSGFRPLSVLSGQNQTTNRNLWVRRGMVVFQFDAEAATGFLHQYWGASDWRLATSTGRLPPPKVFS